MRIKNLEHLDDYVTGTMSDDEAAGFEEELFAAAATGDAEEARWFERFHLLLAAHAQGDVFIRGSTAQDIEAIRQSGARVHLFDLVLGGSVQYAPPADADIIVTRVPIDVRDYESVEATIENPDGRVLHTFRDCMGDPESGHLYAICARPLANMAWGGTRVGRVTGVKRGETERKELATYRLEPAARR